MGGGAMRIEGTIQIEELRTFALACGYELNDSWEPDWGSAVTISNHYTPIRIFLENKDVVIEALERFTETHKVTWILNHGIRYGCSLLFADQERLDVHMSGDSLQEAIIRAVLRAVQS